MQTENAKIVSQICELLFDQITDDHARAVVDITCDENPDVGSASFSYLVAIGLMPQSIQASLNRSVFQSVGAFFERFGVVCEWIEDDAFGTCIRLHVPEKIDLSKASRIANPKLA